MSSIDEIAYTYGYCDELNPLRASLALLQAGVEAPQVELACELGFGHGLSISLHAAGTPVRWYGTDFNPAHAAFAQMLADSAGSQALLCGENFATFCARDDLPEFDFIGLHGIWSWIGADDRALIVDFIGRKLRPGGVLYLSYNTQPGWAAMLPVRELLYRYSQASERHDSLAGTANTPPQPVASRVTAAIDFMQDVFAAQPGYAVVNPQLAERVAALAGENPNYLAHEYFNPNWQPQSFAQVGDSLTQAGLTYVSSADYRDQIDEINLTPAQRNLIAGVTDVAVRETLRDFCMNRSLRRDYWVKQARLLNADEQRAALRLQRVVLAMARDAVLLRVRGALGEATLPPARYEPILDTLSHHRAMTLGDIEDQLRPRGFTLQQIVKAVTLLIGTGVLLNAQGDAQIDAARPRAAKLNGALCERAREHPEVGFLTSPVSGSGIAMPRVAQLFLLARAQGLTQPVQWAGFAHAALRASAEVLQNAAAEDLSMETLTGKADRFAQRYLPILQALGIG